MTHAVNSLATLADDAVVDAAATAATTAAATASSSGGGGPVDMLANAFEAFLTVRRLVVTGGTATDVPAASASGRLLRPPRMHCTRAAAEADKPPLVARGRPA